MNRKDADFKIVFHEWRNSEAYRAPGELERDAKQREEDGQLNSQQEAHADRKYCLCKSYFYFLSDRQQMANEI